MKIFYGVVCINCNPTDQLRLLVESTRKKFLTTHEVDIVILSNNGIGYPNTKNIIINVEPEFVADMNYILLNKILALNFIDFNEYDYVFVSDIDQMWVNEVLDSDLLLDKFCMPNHFWNTKLKNDLPNWSDVIFTNNGELDNTMGNFFGGPSNIMKNLVSYVNEYWSKYKHHKSGHIGFFCLHAEEVLLVTFTDEKKIPVHRLTSQLYFTNKGFLTNINAYGDILLNLHNFKLVHNIKVDMFLANKIFEISCK